MSETAPYDICVIGGSSAGLSIAIGAALLGVPVALVDPGQPGADGARELALATLLATADRIQNARRIPGSGVEPTIDLAAIQRHVADIVASAAPASSPERLRSLGIHLIEGRARFMGRDRIATDTGQRLITARRFVVAPVGADILPAIPGLADVPVLKPESFATLAEVPEHLAILGGGAEALELAQAWRRLGAAVTVLADGPLLDGYDPELVDLLRIRLGAEGIAIRSETPVRQVAQTARGLRLMLAGEDSLVVSHLMVAAGRTPDLDHLDLAAAGITRGPAGIEVDGLLRTSNRRIHAIGAAIGPCPRTHQATAEAGIALRNILFRQRPRFDPASVPRTVRTSPGLAEVGTRPATARGLSILRWPLHDTDRARADGRPHGLVKAMTDRKGRILSAAILAPEADDLLQTWLLATRQRLKISAISSLMTAYPTLGEASKRAAGSFFAQRLLSTRTKRLVRWLAMFG